jgi:rRNA processing protein Krr1/Pno1
VTIKGKTVRVLADTATSNAGKKAVIKVIEGNKSSTVISIKLDSKGDLSRSLPARKSGKGGYTLNKGDKLELTVGGKVVASATI